MFVERCQHSVYITPADLSLQKLHGVPRSASIAWYCWACRPFGLNFSEGELLKYARMSQAEAEAQSIRAVLGAAA
jgi:hypothetical protein